MIVVAIAVADVTTVAVSQLADANHLAAVVQTTAVSQLAVANHLATAAVILAERKAAVAADCWTNCSAT